ncbi:MAG TPA: putative porin [Pyrinomonadaceae bacterium]|nr:putative porin [Pyrinomonadaceae bacterium]
MLRLKISRAKISRALLLLLCALSTGLTFSAQAQSSNTARTAATAAPTEGSVASNSSDLEEVRRELREQQEEIRRMRAIVTEQSQVIDALRLRVEHGQGVSAGGLIETRNIPVSDTAPTASTGQAQSSDTDARLTRVEEQTKKTGETLSKQLGSISFSGDIRLRYESFYGQLNALANGDNPLILGNELSTRQRFRIRARLAMRGQIGKEFDWGLRLASGSFADSISANQTLTDFYNRKPFGLDQAYIAWTPERVPGLRLQGGKFDVPWTRTEMTIDNDLPVEGFSQTYSRTLKKSTLNNLTFVAWELPFLERNSAFVRNANGTVNLEESHRGGRDLALYGAQLRARFEPTKKVALTLSAADLYFYGTQFISPIQVFGNQLQLPVTFTIPATANTPAQTITTQVSIGRDLLVAGNGNLGLSIGSTNAINRDGRLASGYNLVDLIGRLDWARSARFPITLLFNFVTNTQTHDVSVAGAGGATLFLPNNEKNGYWAEFQMGRSKDRNDVQFGYTFARIEKDAVLTPFNMSDSALASDTRLHRLIFNYTADPRVVLSFISIINQRPHGLLGVFGTTPPGSLNRPTTRIQFDTTFRF